MKTMIAEALVNVKEQQDILESLLIFEGKLKALYGAVFGLKIIVMKAPEDKGKREMGSSSTARTN